MALIVVTCSDERKPGRFPPGVIPDPAGALTVLASVPRMMLQHSGPSLADISCSALVPCLSPPATLTLDDFTSFTPAVKEELRLAIHSKRLSSGLGVDLSSDGTSSSSDRPSEHLAAGPGCRREVRLRGSPPPPRGSAPAEAEVTRLLCAVQVSPQEVERRKRRRERNKIAAAKCRNKKKEKTESLQKVLLFQKADGATRFSEGSSAGTGGSSLAGWFGLSNPRGFSPVNAGV